MWGSHVFNPVLLHSEHILKQYDSGNYTHTHTHTQSVKYKIVQMMYEPFKILTIPRHPPAPYLLLAKERKPYEA